jgi:DNA transformation protein
VDGAAIQDLFEGLGQIRTRRMFSGYGVFLDDACFALALRGELYLKVDRTSESLFRAAGSGPFTYSRQGREVSIAFWRLPDEALDDPDAATRWGRIALEAARRAKAAKPRRTPKPARRPAAGPLPASGRASAVRPPRR